MDVVEAPQLLLRTNKPDGFDCPDKKHTSTFEFCENGAKVVTWEVTDKRVTPEFFATHMVAELSSWTDYALENAGRLAHPMAYDPANDTYKPIDWDTAFARIGEVLRALPAPNMAEFYASGRTSNEAAFLFQLFGGRSAPTISDCSNMCHEATSVGLPQSIGIGKGSVSLDDFDHCELIIPMGHNPWTHHPRMMGTLHEIRRPRRPDHCLQPAEGARSNASPIPRTRSRWPRSARRASHPATTAAGPTVELDAFYPFDPAANHRSCCDIGRDYRW